MKVKTRFLTLTATMSLLAASGSGCSVGAGGDGFAASPAPTPTPTSMAQLHLPLDAYQPEAGQLAESGALRSLLERQCMREFGFERPAPSGLSETIASSTRVENFLRGRRYGLSDRAVAARYGYRVPEWTLGTAKPESLNELSAAEKTVLTGNGQGGQAQYQGKAVPAGGCKGQADRQTGVLTGSGGLAGQLQRKTFQLLENDPRARKAISRWSKCMAAKGYQYTDPWRSGANFASDAERTAQPSSAEIKSALASVDCTYSVNLLGELFAVESDLQNIEIEKNAEALNKEKKQVVEQAKRLQELVDQYGG